MKKTACLLLSVMCGSLLWGCFGGTSVSVDKQGDDRALKSVQAESADTAKDNSMTEALNSRPLTGVAEGPKTYIWPEGKMPDAQPHQIAATTEEAAAEGFSPDENRCAYLQWFQPPPEKVRTDACMIIISGGGYYNCCDMPSFAPYVVKLLEAGLHCVNFTYRTPRPEGIPIYKTAWEDGQRAVRLVRAEAAKRGFSPDKIGVVGCSAGSHLCMLLGLSSQTPAYEPIDEFDAIPCNVNWMIPMCPAYVLSDGLLTENQKGGVGDDVTIDPVFAFDGKTCPSCFLHGGDDPYSPYASIKAYKRLIQLGIPAELHLEANGVHGFMNYVRLNTPQVAIDFLRRTGFLPKTGSLPMGEGAAKCLEAADAWAAEQQKGRQKDLSLFVNP